MTLTKEGRKWAEDNRDNSIVARLALELGDKWPEQYVTTAIQAVNAMAEGSR